MGDLDAKVGRGRRGEIVDHFGSGVRKERGYKWVEWCKNWNNVVLNTFSKHHPRNQHAWENQGDRARNQIDHVTMNSMFTKPHCTNENVPRCRLWARARPCCSSERNTTEAKEIEKEKTRNKRRNGSMRGLRHGDILQV